VPPVTAAPGPARDDQVIGAAGARTFVKPQAAPCLTDKVLDAQKARRDRPLGKSVAARPL